jgi:fructokinase
MKQYKIGIDLGGTKTEVIIIDPDNNESYRKRVPTEDKNDYHTLLSFVHILILETIDNIPQKANCTIGVGIPGSINTETQLVQNANTICLIGNPFQKDLEKLLARNIGMENDANCFTLAESRSGAARGYNFVFGIIMGTGCGGGICINGKVVKGLHGIAGEWGHFSVDPIGDKCYCGNLGCVETKISGSGVENAFYKKYNIHMKMHEIVQGARNKDTKCNEAVKQFLDDFGRCVGGLISILDPDAIVIGGGLSNIDELYTKGVEQVRNYAFHRKIQTPIIKNKLGDSAGVFGAAWIGK